MSFDLVVDTAINAAVQPVKDQAGKTSALQVGTDFVVVGKPRDNGEVFGVIATPPPHGSHIQFGNIGAIEGQPSASLTFAGWDVGHAGFVWIPKFTGGSLKLAFGMSNDPNENPTKFVFNADGTAAFPGLPNLPASGTSDLTVDPAGNIAPQTSSLRFKENVETLNDDFQKILALEPKSFIYKETGVSGIGYAAEDVDELELNNLVGYDADGKPLTINYKFIPIYLLEVLKEQQKAIKELKPEVGELKASLQK